LKSRLLFLWIFVALFVAGVVIGLNWFNQQIQHEAFERTQREATLANDTFVEHTRQIVGQADNLLRAVRSHYIHTRSIEQTETFIASLGLEKGLYENIYLIDASGKVVIAHEAVAKVRNTADREYFQFHLDTSDDVIYFAPTDKGRITNQLYFRITRRITLPDGAFGGVMVMNVRPNAWRHRCGAHWRKPPRAHIAMQVWLMAPCANSFTNKWVICHWSWLTVSPMLTYRPELLNNYA
jgi:hypothetical protein